MAAAACSRAPAASPRACSTCSLAEQLAQLRDEIAQARADAAALRELPETADDGELQEALQRLQTDALARHEALQAELEALRAAAADDVVALRAEAAAGRTTVEERLADMSAELMAARTDADQARRGVDALRDELTALREYAAAARAEAAAALESATAARQAIAADDRRFEELRTDVAAVMASVQEFKHGFDEARQAAVTARRDAEAARAAAERVGAVNEETTEKFTEVWREMLAAKPAAGEDGVARHMPRVSVPKREAPEPRPEQAGFDDQPQPMAVIDLEGRFRHLNPAFSKLVGYGEHEFSKATWPSVLDRKVYKEQMGEFERMVAGEQETAEVQSTYMHGQGLMVLLAGEARLVRDAEGKPDHVLIVADGRDHA